MTETQRQAEIARRRGVDRGAGLLAWADRATGRPLRSEEKRRFLDAVRSGDVDAVPVEPTRPAIVHSSVERNTQMSTPATAPPAAPPRSCSGGTAQAT